MRAQPSLLSKLTKVNLITLCIMALLFVLMVLSQFMPAVVLLLAGVLLLTYLLLGPVHFIESRLMHEARKGKRWLQSPGLRRTLAILAVYLLGAMLVAGMVYRMVPPVLSQLSDFAQELPAYLEKAGHSPQSDETGPATFSELVGDVLSSRPGHITGKEAGHIASTLFVKKVAAVMQEYASRIGTALLNLGTTAVAALLYFLTALVMTFYLLHDGKLVKEAFVDMMPNQAEGRVSHYLDRLHLQFYTFLKGQVTVSVLWALLIYILLMLTGVKYPLLLALVFGIATIIPVIGPWIGLIPIALVVLLSDQPAAFLQVLGFSGIFYLLKTYWLWPRLIQRKYDVHPVMFILTFLVCLQTVGYGGILLSFPLASILGATSEYLKETNPALKDVLAADDHVAGARAAREVVGPLEEGSPGQDGEG